MRLQSFNSRDSEALLRSRIYRTFADGRGQRGPNKE